MIQGQDSVGLEWKYNLLSSLNHSSHFKIIYYSFVNFGIYAQNVL